MAVQFCDESVAQWFCDLEWAWNDEKVRALLLAVFSRRTRASTLQARFQKRVIDLYWRRGWTKREIAEKFGVGKEDVRRIVRSLRNEAKKFFSTDVTGTDATEPNKKARQEHQPRPINADPANKTQAHWEAVLASHGLFDPDKPVYWGQQQWKNPRYKFHWPVTQTSAYMFAWAEFFESFQVPYDPERVHHFLAHIPTAGDVERAIDGDAEAQVFLREYERVRDEKAPRCLPFRDPSSA